MSIGKGTMQIDPFPIAPVQGTYPWDTVWSRLLRQTIHRGPGRVAHKSLGGRNVEVVYPHSDYLRSNTARTAVVCGEGRLSTGASKIPLLTRQTPSSGCSVAANNEHNANIFGPSGIIIGL